MTTSFEAMQGDGPLETPSASRADIFDELRDHLACRRDELEAAGLPPAAAEAEALRQFGDPERVARELNWLHNGDRIMKQRLLWLAVAIIVLGLCATLFIQNRQYRAMLFEQQALARDMAAQSQAMLAAVKAGSPSASARIRVVDDQGRPRPGRTITIRGRWPSPQLSGSICELESTSDADGRLDTGPIPLGAYTLMDNYADFRKRGIKIRATKSFNLFQAVDVPEIEFVVPALTVRRLTFQRPAFPDGFVPIKQSWYVDDRDHIVGRTAFEFDVPTDVAFVRNARLCIDVTLHGPPQSGPRPRDISATLTVDEAQLAGDLITFGRLELVNGRFQLADSRESPASSASAP